MSVRLRTAGVESGDGVTYTKHGATVDARGGIHPLCGSATISTTGAPYWPYRIARGIAITEGGSGGFTVDGKGGVHPFGKAHFTTKPTVYWHNWDIARGVAVDGHGQGVIIDGWGGIHSFTYTVRLNSRPRCGRVSDGPAYETGVMLGASITPVSLLSTRPAGIASVLGADAQGGGRSLGIRRELG